MRGPRAGWSALTAPPATHPPVASSPATTPPLRPGAKSAARARFRFRLRRPLGGGDEPPAGRHHDAGTLPASAAETRAERPAPGAAPAPPRLPLAGRPEDAPPALGLPTLRPLASPGRARRPRSFLPSARPSERRRPAGSLKRRRLPPPPPPRRSLPLSSHGRSLHVKPPEWSQDEVGKAATYGGGAGAPPSAVAVGPSRPDIGTRGASAGAGSSVFRARGRPRSCQKREWEAAAERTPPVQETPGRQGNAAQVPSQVSQLKAVCSTHAYH